MLNFRDNFFFAKFTVLFFILTIFGYWGIDLNSEELYIAFSFFLLVIAGLVMSRKSILTLFVKSVNAKYFRLLTDLVIMTHALTIQQSQFEYLFVLNMILYTKLKDLSYFVLGSVSEAAIANRIFDLNRAVLMSLFGINVRIYGRMLGGVKKSYSFKKFARSNFIVKI